VPLFCLDFLTHAEEGSKNPVARGAYPLPGLPHACTPLGHPDVLQPFSQIPGVIIAFLSPEGRILEFNPGAERLTGCLRHEVLGKDGVEVFFPEAVWAEAAHQLQRVLSGESAEGILLPLKVRRGRARACRWYYSLISDRLGQPAGIMMVGQYLAESETWESRPRAGLARAYPQPGIGRGCLTRRTGTC
jgi:PAS domain S-box-containing protein